jgi:diguanylate cyclase (GGDEF)-like protein
VPAQYLVTVYIRRRVDRKPRPTAIEAVVPGEHLTEEFDAVMPAFGNTVTITEVGDTVVEAAPAACRATFVVVAGPSPGQVYSLGSEHVIGREITTSIVIDDGAVSRQHARIVDVNGCYLIEDLGSRNGTFVNGTRVSRAPIDNGDRVQLGPRVVLRFGLLEEAEEQMLRQLFESSTRDPLTGAYNKKYLFERLHAEVAHAVRHHSSLELIVFDLDKFKQINDRYGHLTGDKVLRSIAECVHALIRSEDVFARFGGEEFVVITRGSNATRLAERIRDAVERRSIATDRGPLQVTLSCGVARIDELQPTSPSTLLDLADRRLLFAKREGRNRVCAADPS